MRLEIAGENSLILYLSDTASPQVAEQLHVIALQLKQVLGDKLIDLIPSYVSLLIIYDPFKSDHFELRSQLKHLLKNTEKSTATDGQTIYLPVYYAPESGPDLQAVAKAKNLSVDQVIALHSERDYRVYAIGFAPGFAYLGETDERLATPRLATPRQKVPAGSVAIADRQTAVYPSISPGGWHLLGLCPQAMFDATRQPPMLIKNGDSVRFEPIDRDRFLALGGQLP